MIYPIQFPALGQQLGNVPCMAMGEEGDTELGRFQSENEINNAYCGILHKIADEIA